MKNLTTILGIAVISLSLFACSQKEIKEPAQQAKESETKPIKFSEKTLEFSSHEEFSKTLWELVAMNSDERAQWSAKNPGFVSQSQAAQMASMQLMNCKSEEEAIKLRDAYKEFVFNMDLAEADFTPNVKADQMGHAMLVNAYGDVKIANKIVNLNNVESYEETWIGQLEQKAKTKGMESSTNYLHSWTDERKMWIEAFAVTIINPIGGVVRRELVLRTEAHQKICFIFCGWHTYQNEFIFNTRFPVNINNGFDVRSGLFETLFNYGREVVYLGGNSHPMLMGHINGYPIEAELFVHTQGVGAGNQGTLKIFNPRQVNYYIASNHYDW